MSKRINLIFILFLSAMITHAQENAIKAGFTGPFMGDLNIGYERAVSQNSSVNIKLGYFDLLMSPFISENTLTPKAYSLLEANGGFTASVEYRFYVSKKRGVQGFYVAPYLRYISQDMVFDDEIEGYIFTVGTKANITGLGGQLGYQWIFNDWFTLDLFFFGTGIDYYKAEINYVLEPQPSGFNYTMVTPHVDDVFVDYKYLHKKLTHEVNDDNHTSKLPFLFPGMRIGASIGIAF
jgi:hypothetical protein